MDWPLVVSIVANLLLLFLYIRSKVKRPKVDGSVVLIDTKNMYIEVDSNDALSELYDKSEAIFRVKTHK